MILCFQVASAWIGYDTLSRVGGVIFSDDKTSMLDKCLAYDDALKAYKKRHCILIEQDENQFEGQVKRMEAWEGLPDPVQECESPTGNYHLLTTLFKTRIEQGNICEI